MTGEGQVKVLYGTAIYPPDKPGEINRKDRMNTVSDTIKTLLPDAQRLATMILETSREIFEGEDHEVKPMAFYVPLKGGIQVIAISELSDQTKPGVWAFVRQLRQSFPIVAFVSEVWMAKVNPGDVNPDGSVKIMPRDHPNKIEQVMLTLWQGDRHVSFTAEIKRQPDRLEEWNIMFDSYFPQDNKSKVEGRMMEGADYPLNQS